jgi:hypothetical protein
MAEDIWMNSGHQLKSSWWVISPHEFAGGMFHPMVGVSSTAIKAFSLRGRQGLTQEGAPTGDFCCIEICIPEIT